MPSLDSKSQEQFTQILVDLAELRFELKQSHIRIAALERANADLERSNTQTQEENHRLRVENQILRDEVARLKGLKGKPKINPSRLTKQEKSKRGGHRKNRQGKTKNKSAPNRIEIVKAVDVPVDSVFKGYADYTVRELVITAETIRYRAEKWLTPEGKVITAKLPVDKAQGHFGPVLRSFVLYQYYHALVTEPLILEQLREWGVSISSGQVHRLITAGKERFHQEKDEILRVGLRLSNHIHVDDTGARHQGKNGYCTHIGNEWFAWFESTKSKSRINFLTLLRAGCEDYVLSSDALEYMSAQKMPKQVLQHLAAAGEQTFTDKNEWKAALESFGITRERHIRIATEGVLLGSVLAHGINPKLVIMSDDAGQFNILIHTLCWIHAERLLAKLVGFNDDQVSALERVRSSIWELYRDLKAYKMSPTAKAKKSLEKRFDDVCATRTCFTSLDLALKRMGKNKKELLLVLERPELPLHNNLSEGDIREYVKRRKISGGTRNEDGRRARDTFASLKKTCRKLGVSFWSYINDRVVGQSQIAPLPQLIEARAMSS